MVIDSAEMRALQESLERRTKTLDALADAAARQASVEERIADAYLAAIDAGWTKKELADAGVKEPTLVRRRRETEKNQHPSEQHGEYNQEQ
ncbi:hypothetical protein QEV69_04595 [Trueperella pyogenes]|uniref:hypothetical protein n=1 Tax=Trueperella pyogenes TaxID=1661 RepID=UPI003246CFF5